MKKILSLLLVFISFSAMSQEATVISVNKGEAKIKLPDNVKIEKGDIVYLSKEKEVLLKKDFSLEAKIKKIESKIKREHGVSFSFNFSATKSKNINTKDSILNFKYQYNLGYFEPFAEFGHQASSSKDKTVFTANYLGGGLKINLIENKPTNYLIPFVFGGLVYGKGGQGSNNVEMAGTMLGLGTQWFVVKENLSIDLTYRTSNLNTQIVRDGTVRPEDEFKTTLQDIFIGLSFYF